MINYQQQGLGGIPPYGYQPQAASPAKFTNTLTAEEIKSLRQNTEAFSLGLTNEERLRGICFHRDESGKETLRENADGTVTCTICGKTFVPVMDLNPESVEGAINNLVDILQTTKMLYLDMPEEAAREYYQIIPLIEKCGKLYEIASKNFIKHEQWQNYSFSGNPTTMNLYNMMAGGFAFGGSQYGNPMMQQQQMAAPMGAGPMGSAPIANGYVPMGSNGFGYTQTPPQAGYQPQVNGYAYQPSNPYVQAPQVQAPTGDTTTAQTVAEPDKVQVNAKFEG